MLDQDKAIAPPPPLAIAAGGLAAPTINMPAIGPLAPAPSVLPPIAVPPTIAPGEISPALNPAAVGEVVDSETGEASTDDDEPAELIEAARLAPPWLVSCIFHMGVMIILGLLAVRAHTDDVTPELTVVTPGDASGGDDETTLGAANVGVPDLGKPEPGGAAGGPDTLTAGLPVGDLVKEGGDEPMTSVAVGALGTGGGVGAPSMGILLSGRGSGIKGALVKAYGGSEGTETAVGAGLAWLARQQQKSGGWSLHGPYADPGEIENPQVATALALLAYQGAGYTATSGDDPAFRLVADKGLKSLLKRQQSDGNFLERIPEHHNFYSQAICTLALCEAYAMTHDPELRDRAQRAVDYLVKNQTTAGGWKYKPHRKSDLSVSGWVMMALQSARMAGLQVPQGTLYQFEQFLESVAHDGGRQYSYEPRKGASLAMSAEGLLSREFLGWKQDDPRLVEGAKRLLETPIDYKHGQDVYYWYYATQALHHLSGDAWEKWNKVMSVEVPNHQVRRGAETGSWNPMGDAWGSSGGRLYTTCMSLYLLEVYYRHLPIYSQNLDLTVHPPATSKK